MYNKPIKKVIYLLNIGDFAPEVTKITYPFIRRYADKIGAEIHEIRERKFDESIPIVYEKLQIYELAQENQADWNIYIDSDTLINPDCFDWTLFIPKDTVAHNGKDMAAHRWRYDRYFRRDGRNIGSCNWFAIAPADCIDLWKPLDDITVEEAIKNNIFPTVSEELSGCFTDNHLIDDYTLSRNIAKYGLKHTTLIDICKSLNYEGNGWLWHAYNVTEEQKLNGWVDPKTGQKNPGIHQVMQVWGIA